MLYDTEKHIKISDARRLISAQHVSDRLGVFDVTHRPGFGYEFAVFAIDAEEIRFGEPLLTSKSASDPAATNKLGQKGAAREVFDRAELAEIIENAPAPRRIEMQLIAFGQERDSRICTPREARLLLAEPMATGHRWQIAPPYTAEPDQDAEEERYRLDCEAVGIDPSDVLDPRGA